MGRPPRIHPHYRDDGAFLIRVADSLIEDTRLDQGERLALANECESLGQRLRALKVEDETTAKRRKA